MGGGSREEREKAKNDALNQWQNLAKPWMVDGDAGVKVRDSAGTGMHLS